MEIWQILQNWLIDKRSFSEKQDIHELNSKLHTAESKANDHFGCWKPAKLGKAKKKKKRLSKHEVIQLSNWEQIDIKPTQRSPKKSLSITVICFWINHIALHVYIKRVARWDRKSLVLASQLARNKQWRIEIANSFLEVTQRRQAEKEGGGEAI